MTSLTGSANAASAARTSGEGRPQMAAVPFVPLVPVPVVIGDAAEAFVRDLTPLTAARWAATSWWSAVSTMQEAVAPQARRASGPLSHLTADPYLTQLKASERAARSREAFARLSAAIEATSGIIPDAAYLELCAPRPLPPVATFRTLTHRAFSPQITRRSNATSRPSDEPRRHDAPRLHRAQRRPYLSLTQPLLMRPALPHWRTNASEISRAGRESRSAACILHI